MFLKHAKKNPLLYIQVPWADSVIYTQYKFVLKIQGFILDKT